MGTVKKNLLEGLHRVKIAASLKHPLKVWIDQLEISGLESIRIDAQPGDIVPLVTLEIYARELIVEGEARIVADHGEVV